MKRHAKTPLSYRQSLTANRAAGRGYAAAFGKEPMAMDLEPTLRKRTFAEQKVVNAAVRGEGDVQREILKHLRSLMRGNNPLVVILERHNSGGLPDATGRVVKFHRVQAAGRVDVRMPDITAKLRDGRQFACECKTPDWREPDWDELQRIEDGGKLLSDKQSREMGQRRYLQIVRSAGGIGIFATDVQDVINALSVV